MSQIPDIKAILLATDFSDRSAAAEWHAVALAAQFKASLHVISAIEPIIGVDDRDEDAEEFEEFYGRLLARADREIGTRLKAWADHNVAVKHHVKIGPRWQVVLETADIEGVDIIVMGRSKVAAREGRPLGTTSQKVFFAASRPVLFVSAAE